jgi:hypothetical protein
MNFVPNGLFEREIGLAVFFARPTQTQTDLGCEKALFW